jgi:hypothetical protein
LIPFKGDEVIQLNHLALREENWAHGSRDPESVTKSGGLFHRGRAMPGASRAGHRHLSIDQLVKPDVRRDVTMRSHRRIEFFWYARGE